MPPRANGSNYFSPAKSGIPRVSSKLLSVSRSQKAIEVNRPLRNRKGNLSLRNFYKFSSSKSLRLSAFLKQAIARPISKMTSLLTLSKLKVAGLAALGTSLALFYSEIIHGLGESGHVAGLSRLA